MKKGRSRGLNLFCGIDGAERRPIPARRRESRANNRQVPVDACLKRRCDDKCLPDHSSSKRILIVRLGAMGDILHALPAVTGLRAALPDCWIGWAIEPQWESLLRADSSERMNLRGSAMPVVDVLHTVPAKRWARRPLAPSTWSGIRNLRRELRAEHYDLVIDLQGAVRSAWIGRMAATSLLFGESAPREPLARWFFDERVATTGVHVIDQAREVVSVALQNCGAGPLPNVAAELPLDPGAEEWCADWLAQRAIGRFVLIDPGAGWGAKRWPADRYASVARDLAKVGYSTVVNAGPGEWDLAETIADGARKNVFPMHGGIGQLIACTRRADLSVGGDTGPVHLAAALGTPVVGIYGPTDPARNGPYGTDSRVLRHPSSRRDHTRKKQPEAGLLSIGVDEVVAAARQLLGAGDVAHIPEESRSS